MEEGKNSIYYEPYIRKTTGKESYSESSLTQLLLDGGLLPMEIDMILKFHLSQNKSPDETIQTIETLANGTANYFQLDKQLTYNWYHGMYLGSRIMFEQEQLTQEKFTITDSEQIVKNVAICRPDFTKIPLETRASLSEYNKIILTEMSEKKTSRELVTR